MGICWMNLMIILKGLLKGSAHCDQRWEGVFHTLHSNKPFKGLLYDGYFYVCVCIRYSHLTRMPLHFRILNRLLPSCILSHSITHILAQTLLITFCTIFRDSDILIDIGFHSSLFLRTLHPFVLVFRFLFRLRFSRGQFFFQEEKRVERKGQLIFTA